jgi:hypothetical protein
VTPALVQTLADAMTKDGLLPRSINMADYIDTSYLPFPC